MGIFNLLMLMHVKYCCDIIEIFYMLSNVIYRINKYLCIIYIYSIKKKLKQYLKKWQ